MSDPESKRGNDRKAWRSGKAIGFGLAVLFLLGALVLRYFAPWTNAHITNSDESYTYGFEGYPMPFGEKLHSIYRNEEVGVEIAEAFGAYLARVGYFSPDYGGIVQLKAIDGGYEVYLTYRKRYWDKLEFIEEVTSLAEDLETFVLMKPVTLIIVDEDRDGVYQTVLQ